MQLKELLSNDDAVSPVIGVILMVAITVILAAVIATFVLGLGDNLSNSAPQASFSTDYNGSYLTITHDGGDSINAEELFVRGSNGEDGSWSEGADTVASDGTTGYTDGEKIGAGDSIVVDATDSDTVRVVYQSSDGGSSATLATWEGSNA